MNISLTTELDTFIKEQLDTGMYRSASEVVRDGLRILEKRQKRVSGIEHVLDERLMDPRREPLETEFWDDMKSKARSLNQQPGV